MINNESTTTPLFRKMFYSSLALFLVFCFLISGYMGYFYHKNVQPYKSVINNTLMHADKQHQNLPSDLKKLITASLSCDKKVTDNWECNIADNINLRITKILPEPNQFDNKIGTLERHLAETVMASTLVAFLEQKDKYTLIAELTPFSTEIIGHNNFSKQHFNKSLDELTLGESAELVAITKSPTMFLKDNEKLENQKSHLLTVIEQDTFRKKPK